MIYAHNPDNCIKICVSMQLFLPGFGETRPRNREQKASGRRSDFHAECASAIRMRRFLSLSLSRLHTAALHSSSSLFHKIHTQNRRTAPPPLGAEENNVIHRTLAAACKDNFMVGEDNLFATQFAVGLFYPREHH
jgi:hypothetical protein